MLGQGDEVMNDLAWAWFDRDHQVWKVDCRICEIQLELLPTVDEAAAIEAANLHNIRNHVSPQAR